MVDRVDNSSKSTTAFNPKDRTEKFTPNIKCSHYLLSLMPLT